MREIKKKTFTKQALKKPPKKTSLRRDTTKKIHYLQLTWCGIIFPVTEQEQNVCGGGNRDFLCCFVAKKIFAFLAD